MASTGSLRRAFLSLSDPPERNPDSIHGTFGRTEDWKIKHRQGVAHFLVTAPDVEYVVRRLGALTGLTVEALDEVVDWQRVKLIDEIDVAVDSPYYLQTELSELLANAGVLPMFGFPTRVRPLYSRWIRSRRTLTLIPSVTAPWIKRLPISLRIRGHE